MDSAETAAAATPTPAPAPKPYVCPGCGHVEGSKHEKGCIYSGIVAP